MGGKDDASETLGERVLKGVAQPVAVFRVHGRPWPGSEGASEADVRSR